MAIYVQEPTPEENEALKAAMEATLVDCPEHTFTGKFDVNDGEGSE